MKRKYFHPVLMIIIILLLVLSACGTTSSTLIVTPTSAATNSPEPTITNTAVPSRTPSPTVTPDLAATQQYEEFFSLVQKYYDAGQISTTNGEYVELNNYQHEIANKLSYEWAETGVSAKNFIVSADFEWSNAINTANTSGCGFVFRVQESNQDHYLIILDSLSGVKLASSTDRGTYSIGSPQNGDEKISDFGPGPYQATFTLVVNELKTYVYVNDVYQGEYKLLDYRITDSGPLGTAVLSAASEGYGTRCKMTNVRAWIIDQ